MKQTAGKGDCARRKKPDETGGRRVARAAGGGEVRDGRGRFAAGNHAGRRFGEGQPTDRGGRPAETFRAIALRIAADIPPGHKECVRELAVKAQYRKAIAGDTRAFAALVELTEGKHVNVNVQDGVTRIEYVNDWRRLR